MERKRGFEVVKGYKGVRLPERSTKNSAGYDFFAVEDTKIPSIWKAVVQELIFKEGSDSLFKPTLVPTGVKAYMQDDEALFLYNRSSNPLKRFLLLGNGVGVIDSDYYNNPDNDGHIMFQFINFGFKDITIKKGDKIGQGVFKKFLKADNDKAGGERTGGFGSTGK